MSREPRAFGALLRAGLQLLKLEVSMLTGGRALLIFLAQAAWLATFALIQRFSDEPWEPASFYNRTVLLPSMLPAIALGMASVLSERDIRHLEMSFSSAGGRYQLWCFRLGAAALVGAVSATALAIGTWIFAAREITPWTAAGHAIVPMIFILTLAAFLSVLFNGAQAAGLVTAGVVALAGIVLHGGGASRFDLFVNPFVPPDGLLDPDSWVRTLTFNRLFLLVLTGGLLAGWLGLLQRRERLL